MEVTATVQPDFLFLQCGVTFGSSFQASRHPLGSTLRSYFSKGSEQARRLDWSEESHTVFKSPGWIDRWLFTMPVEPFVNHPRS